MRRWHVLSLVSIALSGGLFAAEPGGDAAVSFERDVTPILKRRCVECHGISKKSAGLRLDAYEHLMAGTRKGAVVVPGKSGESRLVELIQGGDEERMPPPEEAEPLTAEEIAIIKRWIDAGAPPPAAGSRTPPAVELGALPPGFSPVVAVAGDPGGRFLAVGRGARIEVTRLAEGELGPPIAVLDGHRDVVQCLLFSPDGALLASGGFREVVLWKTEDWSELRRLGPHADRVLALDFSADGGVLAAAGGLPSLNGEVVLWEVATGNRLKDLPEVHSDTIFSIDFSPDGKRLATASADRVVGIVDIEAGKRVAGFDGHTHHVVGVRFSPDGTQLLSAGADARIKSWDIEKKSKIKDWGGHSKAVMGLEVSPDGAYVASVSGDRTLRIWDLGGKQLRSYGEAGGYLYTVSIFGKGAYIATGGRDDVVRVYDARENKLLHALAPRR
jgi:WD40 repeat protein